MEKENQIIDFKTKLKYDSFITKGIEYREKYLEIASNDVAELVEVFKKENELTYQEIESQIANFKLGTEQATVGTNNAKTETDLLNDKFRMDLRHHSAEVDYLTILNKVNTLRASKIGTYLANKNFDDLPFEFQNLILQILNFEIIPTKSDDWEEDHRKRTSEAETLKREAEAKNAQEESDHKSDKRKGYTDRMNEK